MERVGLKIFFSLVSIVVLALRFSFMFVLSDDILLLLKSQSHS